MSFANKKGRFCILSVALGISIFLISFSFVKTTDTKNEKNQATYEETANNTQLSLASIEGADTIQLMSAAQEEVEIVSPFMNKFMANVSESVNVRGLADTNSEIVGKLYAGSGGDVLEKGSEWSKISSGNVIGYVSNEFLVFDQEAEALANQVVPWIATVNTDTLRVRKEAGAESGVWGLTGAGDNYKVTQFLDGWVAIDYNGTTGYVASEYVTVAQTIGKGITIEEEQAAIKAEQERLASIKAEEERQERLRQEKAAKAAAKSQQTQRVQSAPQNASVSDEYLLACLVASEAGSEPYEGKLAVANIVLNRLRGGRYGGSITDVIYAKNQFSVVKMGILDRKLASGPNSESMRAAQEALAGVNNVPSYTSFCALRAANYSGYRSYSVIGNQVFYCR